MTNSRISALLPSELDVEQKALYDSIVTGPRSAGPQLFALQDDLGRLNGPFGLMLHIPGIGSALQELGSAVRYRTALTDRVREIAILSVAAATDSEFERYAHERVGRAAGLSEEDIEALRTSLFTSEDAVEQIVFDLCRQLLSDEILGDEEFLRYAAQLDARAMLEIVVLVGYYRTLAQMMHVFDVRAPAGSSKG
ncbi:carboxymuconolactone decarboxylase family protein [Rhodococcus qingshengii]|uniref:carboxymuconolactone decarboxylase family protein n=1 Tax=Rhodococcus qingshengii TaxID=334542 RepID=UPI0024BADFE4|nr:carboxymuconolactone decarboxylase family protein [Rhodococcus qingshengii]MDJ0490243.1 carboxymuconolactone decarboxylase family protein [Rhodococcus qingshengii]